MLAKAARGRRKSYVIYEGTEVGTGTDDRGISRLPEEQPVCGSGMVR